MIKRSLLNSLVMTVLLATPVWAKHSANLGDIDEPVLYYADEQTYDVELGILILKGHVEFSHQGDVLEADYVTYNEGADLVTASGHVRLRRKAGDILFSEYMELTGDMKEGFIRQAKALTSDDARVVSVESRRKGPREEFDQAVYTPCQICGQGDTPTWQLNARRLVRDTDTKKYYFTDASMRFLGVPIVYFPFLYYPTERESGLLAPTANAVSKNEGYYYAQPIFLVIDESKDITLTPVLYTKLNPMMGARYRQRFGNGEISLEGSITKTKDRHITVRKGAEKKHKTTLPSTRGHIWATANFTVNDNIRFRSSGGWVSDRTYFKKYDFFSRGSGPSLDSQAVLEGFWDQDYAAIKVLHFQRIGNISERQRHIADALPFMEYHAVSKKDPFGGRFYFDGDFLNLVRLEGRIMQRGTASMGWKLPYTFSCGQVVTLFAEGRGDFYQVNSNPEYLPLLQGQSPVDREKDPVDNGGRWRGFAQAGGEVRWPFVVTGEGQATIVEPIAQLIGAPRGANSRKLPNEDSVGFEFTDANILARDRIPGRDIIDDGSRVDYGLQFLSQGKLFGKWEGFVGQSYSLNRSLNYKMPSKCYFNPSYTLNQSNRAKLAREQGIGRRLSDYVIRVSAEPISGWVKGHFRTRLDQKSYSRRFTEVGGELGPKELRTHLNYTYLSRRAGTRNCQNFKQLAFKVSSQLSKHWSAHAGGRYDFGKYQFQEKVQGGGQKRVIKRLPHDGKLEQYAGLGYTDDCFTIEVRAKRTFYRDQDIKPGVGGEVIIYFKNLGSQRHIPIVKKVNNTSDRKMFL